MEFLFQKLEVYQRSLDLVESIDKLIESIKGRFPASRIDQLTRASLSVPLNIAEGNGRRRPNERGHFFAIARGSAFEMIAILEILNRKQLISSDTYRFAFSDIQIIGKMLSSLIKYTEERKYEKYQLDENGISHRRKVDTQ